MKIYQQIRLEVGEYEVGLWVGEPNSNYPRTAKLDEIERTLLFKLTQDELTTLVKRLGEHIPI